MALPKAPAVSCLFQFLSRKGGLLKIACAASYSTLGRRLFLRQCVQHQCIPVWLAEQLMNGGRDRCVGATWKPERDFVDTNAQIG